MVPTAPAIANVVFNGAGIRIDSMPLTSQKIWEALQTRA